MSAHAYGHPSELHGSSAPRAPGTAAGVPVTDMAAAQDPVESRTRERSLDNRAVHDVSLGRSILPASRATAAAPFSQLSEFQMAAARDNLGWSNAPRMPAEHPEGPHGSAEPTPPVPSFPTTRLQESDDSQMLLQQHGSGGSGAPGTPPASNQRRPSNLHRLHIALQGCDSDAAVETALRAVARECRPSKATVTKLISKYSKAGAWRRGLAVFKHLHLLDVDMDLSLANAALWACKRGGDAAEAWLVFHHMQTMTEHPDIITYRALFPVLTANGMWQECCLAYIVAFGDSVRLDGPAFLFLMLALRHAGLWQLAEACLLTELSQPGRTCAFSELADSIRGAHTLKAEPPADAANVLLWKVQELFRERGLLAAAERGGALRRSALIHDALVTPCCNIVLQMYAEASPPQADRSLAFICAMASACKAAPGGPLQPDVISYGAVALGFCRLGSVARGLGVLAAYTHTGQRLSPAMFEPCMAAAAAADDDAAIISIWRHMASLGVTSSSACSTMFIGAASRSRSADLSAEALPWVLSLPKSSLADPLVLRDVSLLLVSLAQLSSPPQAVTAFQCVMGAGIRLPVGCVAESVRVLSWRDAACCAALRQTAAVAGYELPLAGTNM